MTPVDFEPGASDFINIPSSNGSAPLLMKDYASLCFARLRQMHGITADDYVQSWQIPLHKLKPQLGAGRSGSLFLRSNDQKYIFKTIPHAELRSVTELLPHYYQHVVKNPGCLIARIFGLHKFRNSTGFMQYIIVLGNCVNPLGLPSSYSPVQLFDLKGRTPKPGKAFRNRGKQGIVFKDNDLERKFFFSKEKLHLFLTQLDADIAFLQTNNLMDYSFLIGVVSKRSLDDSEPLPSTPNRSTFCTQCGGIVNDNFGTEIYYVGIIDFLARYGAKKKAANFFKSFRWEADQLSTVDSVFYGERLKKYLRDIFVEIPDGERGPIPSSVSSSDFDGVSPSPSESSLASPLGPESNGEGRSPQRDPSPSSTHSAPSGLSHSFSHEPQVALPRESNAPPEVMRQRAATSPALAVAQAATGPGHWPATTPRGTTPRYVVDRD
eukprot:TRINITY_DN35174_c0_g1_i1.p1 TRINITY_DN35174_c0_g1~~TRINITY_DN35174_c0_g1_i1.p1  ORF type:complete len:496 (-),score=61.59 TRINITY_DN35174_c0_g1_i1:153-1460(-)